MNPLRNLIGLEVNGVKTVQRAVNNVAGSFRMGLQPNMPSAVARPIPTIQLPRAIQGSPLSDTFGYSKKGVYADPNNKNVYYNNGIPMYKPASVNQVVPLQNYAYKLGTRSQPMNKLPLL